jgi:hypothetical protein
MPGCILFAGSGSCWQLQQYKKQVSTDRLIAANQKYKGGQYSFAQQGFRNKGS